MTQQEQIEALSQKLNENSMAMDSALESLLECYGETVKDTDAYLEISGELAENEELLIKIESL